jgi:hypothetical protein
VSESARVTATSPTARRVDARQPLASWRRSRRSRYNLFGAPGAVPAAGLHRRDQVRSRLRRRLTDGHSRSSIAISGRLAERSRHLLPKQRWWIRRTVWSSARRTTIRTRHSVGRIGSSTTVLATTTRTAITPRAWCADSRASSLVAGLRPRARVAAGLTRDRPRSGPAWT